MIEKELEFINFISENGELYRSYKEKFKKTKKELSKEEKFKNFSEEDYDCILNAMSCMYLQMKCRKLGEASLEEELSEDELKMLNNASLCLILREMLSLDD